MYERFYGLPRSPFAVTPDPSLLYLRRTHREALATIIYGKTLPFITAAIAALGAVTPASADATAPPGRRDETPRVSVKLPEGSTGTLGLMRNLHR